MGKRTVAFIASVVVLAACSSTTEAETSTTVAVDPGASTTTAVSDTTTTTGSVDSTTTTEGTTTTTSEPSASLAECAVGVWELDSQAFFDDLIASMPPEEVVGEFLLIDGAYLLTIGADGTVVNERKDWTFGVDSDYGQLEIRINSVQTGTYTIDGDVVTTSMDPAPPADVRILVDDVPVSFPGGVSPVEPPDAEFTGATITCSGDVLTATADGFSSTWDRIG
jgi:hypothetical protein